MQVAVVFGEKVMLCAEAITHETLERWLTMHVPRDKSTFDRGDIMYGYCKDRCFLNVLEAQATYAKGCFPPDTFLTPHYMWNNVLDTTDLDRISAHRVFVRPYKRPETTTLPEDGWHSSESMYAEY